MRFVLYAASTTFASELAESAVRAGFEYVAVRNLRDAPVPQEIGAVLDADSLPDELLALPFAVPQTVPANRYAAVADARARGFAELITLIDPTAVVASSAAVGVGAYIGTAAVVGAGASVGDGALVNRSCSIGHHTVIGDWVGTGPGVVIAGMSTIGRGAFVGAGAVVGPQLTVGEGAVVGAGAVVIADVEPGQVVVGNPAKVLRRVEPELALPAD